MQDCRISVTLVENETKTKLGSSHCKTSLEDSGLYLLQVCILPDNVRVFILFLEFVWPSRDELVEHVQVRGD